MPMLSIWLQSSPTPVIDNQLFRGYRRVTVETRPEKGQYGSPTGDSDRVAIGVGVPTERYCGWAWLANRFGRSSGRIGALWCAAVLKLAGGVDGHHEQP